LYGDSFLLSAEWYSFQETAKYKCSGNVTGRERRHFSLPQMPCYVHFTSPIRRYVDMIAHRLLHAALNRKESPYNCEEVKELCKSITERGQQHGICGSEKCLLSRPVTFPEHLYFAVS
jgi:exoribonuclease R